MDRGGGLNEICTLGWLGKEGAEGRTNNGIADGGVAAANGVVDVDGGCGWNGFISGSCGVCRTDNEDTDFIRPRPLYSTVRFEGIKLVLPNYSPLPPY